MDAESKYKCIVFDVDGTLTQTAPLIFESFNYVAEKYTGKTYTVPEIVSRFGPPEEMVISSLVGADKAKEAMDDYLRYYHRNHNKLARLFPSVKEMLNFLRERSLHLAIFTGKCRATTNITLEEFSILGYFDYIVTGNDVKSYKPSAEGLIKIINYFSLNPENLLMVGDSRADIEASRHAGVSVALALWDTFFIDDVLPDDVDYTFRSIEEFFGWLKERINHN